MRSIILAFAVAVVSTAHGVAGTTHFNYYASPVLAYYCAGYSASTCFGFESSDPGHGVQSVGIKVTSQSPLQFQVSAFVDNTPYKGYYILASNAGLPFLMTDTVGAGTTVMMSVNFAATRHCVGTGATRHCADRYLPESGTVSIPP